MTARARELSTMASVGVVGIALGAALAFQILESRSATAAVPPEPEHALELPVPHAASDVRVDGALDEAAWTDPGRTGAFLEGQELARPYSDVRAVWRGGTLYLALYAADEDIVAPVLLHDAPTWTGDAFQIVFRRGGVEHTIDVSARGTITDGERIPGRPFDPAWESRAVVGVDRDGTVDDPSDMDEEWVVELGLPLASLGLVGRSGERIGFEVRRCDELHDLGAAPRRSCAAWGNKHSELVLR